VKLGCFGCLSLIVLILLVVMLGGGLLFLSTHIFTAPDLQSVSFSKADGYSAQQKLYELILRGAGRSSRADTIVLTEREVNAFLANHLDQSAGLPLSPLTVKLEEGQFFLQGQTSLMNLLRAPVFSYLAPYLTDPRLDRQVWVSIRGRVDVEGAGSGGTRHGTVTVTEFVLGRQPLSSFLLYAAMGPSGSGLFRWVVPSVVDSVEIHPKQVVIRTR